MSSFKINIANIKEVNPNPIHCLALNDGTQKLALFRGGDVCAIEIWDVSHMPFMEKILVELEKVEEKPSVESIVWAKNRLFTGGLHGFVLEHSLITRRIKEKLAATSGPVWCLSVNSKETFLAAGTEDGFINIFEITEEGLLYKRVLDRQDGRVLSLSWSPCGEYIATGSVDSVRLWDVEKGHALRRLMTGRSKNKETIVWSILLLDNLNIVSGDSRGVVSFWNGEIGVLRFKICTHKADVLSLRLSPDKSSIYAAGVDPVVVMLSRMGRNGDKWVRSHQRNMHANDVTSLATFGNKLFSAGYDGDLIVSSFPPKTVTKYPPLTSAANIAVSKKKKLVLVQNVNRIDIWKLPSDTTELTKVLELGSHRKETILSSCLSRDGVFFAYSTFGKINMFNLSITETKKQDSCTLTPQLAKIKFESNEDEETGLDFNDHPQWHIRFVNDASIVAVSLDGELISFISVTEGENSNLSVKSTVEIGETFIDVGVDMIEVSSNGKYLAVVSGGLVLVNELNKNAISSQMRLPQYRCPVSVVLFHPKSPLILIAYVDRSVKIFNLATEKIILDTEIKNSNSLQALLGGSWSAKGDIVVLYDLEGMYLIEMDSDLAKPKKRGRKNSGSSKDETECEFSIKSGGNKYKFVAFVEFLDDGKELLAVEVNPSTLLEKLPPAFVKKRFGM